MTSVVIDAVIKPLARRRPPARPGGRRSARVPPREDAGVPLVRLGSFSYRLRLRRRVGCSLPWAAPPLTVLAFLVACSRVHTGVHYSGDVIFGSLCGVALAEVANRTLGWA